MHNEHHRPRNPPGGIHRTHARIHLDTGHRTSTSKFGSVLPGQENAAHFCFSLASHWGSRVVNSRSFLRTATSQSPVQSQILVPDFGWVWSRKDLWRMLGIGGLLCRNRQFGPVSPKVASSDTKFGGPDPRPIPRPA
jgi:hypothetical protein